MTSGRRARRVLAGAVLAAIVVIAPTASAQLVSRFVAGQDYTVVDPPVAAPEDGRTHVVEFFLYSCPHCYHLEPALAKWRDRLPDDVVFSRVPVLFGGNGETYARLFYAAKSLGVLDRVHADIFDAIHQDGRRLTGRAEMRAFMKAHGVDAQRFDEAYDSDAVTRQVIEAARLMQAMRVTATPSLGVAGRYWVSGRTAGSNQAMFDVADYLIARTRDDADD